MSNKAQIKMGETIAIMFVFFILLVIGAVFYMNLQRTTVSREISEAYEMQSVEISQIITFLPEVQCTDFNVVRPSCFDLYKMIAMSQAVAEDPKNKELYSREFEYTTIKLYEIYPFEGEWILYDNPRTRIVGGEEKVEYTSAHATNVPIVLYNATSDDYYFGVLEITTYQ